MPTLRETTVTEENINETIEAIDELRGMVDYWAERAETAKAIADPTELKASLTLFSAIEVLSELVDELQKKFAAVKDLLRNSYLPKGMATCGVPKIQVGHTEYKLDTRVNANFKDKPVGMNWLRKIGESALIQETVHHATLSKFIKEYIEDKAIDPPDFVNITRMQFVKAKEV